MNKAGFKDDMAVCGLPLLGIHHKITKETSPKIKEKRKETWKKQKFPNIWEEKKKKIKNKKIPKKKKKEKRTNKNKKIKNAKKKGKEKATGKTLKSVDFTPSTQTPLRFITSELTHTKKIQSRNQSFRRGVLRFWVHFKMNPFVSELL